MTNVYTDHALSSVERRSRLFAGDLFSYGRKESVSKLVNLARSLIEEAFHPLDPESAQHELPVQQFVDILAKLKPAFIHHDECKKILPEIIADVGEDPADTYFDVPRLRSSTSDGYLTSGIAYAFHPHRDTWYSAAQCQINWWLPVYPIDADNGMAFHPRYFNEATENSSETYDYYRWNAERGSAAKHVGKDTREQPKLTAEIPLEPDLRLVPEPGGMFLFSAAHLHRSVPNVSGRTRFSIDFRTVHRADIATQAGAPNVDSRCTGTALRDFLLCTDLSRVPDDLVAPYDTVPPDPDAVLVFDQQSESGA